MISQHNLPENEETRYFFSLVKHSEDEMLTAKEVIHLKAQVLSIEADPTCFRYNETNETGFNEKFGIIYVAKDILTTLQDVSMYYRLGEMGILAHEYWGHLKNHPNCFGHNTPEDECWADDSAARRSPGLTDYDRMILFRRALGHAQIARNQEGVGSERFSYPVDDVIRRYISDDEIRKFNR